MIGKMVKQSNKVVFDENQNYSQANQTERQREQMLTTRNTSAQQQPESNMAPPFNIVSQRNTIGQSFNLPSSDLVKGKAFSRNILSKTIDTTGF